MLNRFHIKKISNLDDIRDALHIRTIVFCKEQKVSSDIEFDGLDNLCSHFVAYKNNIPIGTARLREKNNGIYKIERVAVIKSERLRGIGKLIMLDVINEVKKNKNFQELILHSQKQVYKFYEKLGFSRIDNEFLEENIPHVKMIYSLKNKNVGHR